MLIIFSARRCAALFSALCLVACGGALLIIPFFEFGFKNADSSVSLFLVADKPAAESGAFSVANLTTVIGAVESQTAYTGTYSGCGFELKASGVVTPPAATGYSGRFTNKNTVELRPTVSSAATYTLTRLPSGTVPDFGC